MELNDKKCLMNLLLISLVILLSVQMIKSLNRLGLVETYYQEIKDNMVEVSGEVVGKDGLGEKEVDVMFGSPKGLVEGKTTSMKNEMEDAPSDGMGNKTKVLFKHTPCNRDCCEFGKGTNYSCDRGCVCMNKAQNELVASRGDGVYPNEAATNLNYRNKCLIEDEWCKQ